MPAKNQTRDNLVGKGILCAICAEKDAVSMDHVPPQSIFPKPRPEDLITVPACSECNAGGSMTDEEFKVHLSLLAGVETPETRKLWQRGALRTLANNQRLAREVRSRMVKVDMMSPGGLYLRTESAVLVPAEGIHHVLIKTIRGLYFHHYHERLGARARCNIQRWKGPAMKDERLIEIVSRMSLVSIANGSFKYRYARAEDSPLASMWLMQFYGRESVFGFTINANDPWEPDGPPMGTDGGQSASEHRSRQRG
jgi:hypothetical protein